MNQLKIDLMKLDGGSNVTSRRMSVARCANLIVVSIELPVSLPSMAASVSLMRLTFQCRKNQK